MDTIGSQPAAIYRQWSPICSVLSDHMNDWSYKGGRPHARRHASVRTSES